jgi:hypothetical protein
LSEQENALSDIKTHYRKAFDSPYLSSADIVDPITLTIRRVSLDSDQTKKTGDKFNTAHFVETHIRPGEALKPMILNATNSKFLAQLTGSKWIDDWAGAAVTVYVEPNVRFGRETVEGLRLSKAVAGPTASPELLAEAEAEARKGLDSYAAWWKATGNENRSLLAVAHQRFKKLAGSVKT